MHWKLKAHTLAILSRLPGGRRLYHAAQACCGTNPLQIGRELDRAFELLELAMQSGATVRDAFVLEIGTGWRPVVPFVMALCGAHRVITLDINPWLTFGHALETWRGLADHLDEIADRADLDRGSVRGRYRRVTEHPQHLEELFAPLGIDYSCPSDARATTLPAASVDLVVSSNVLEHIPREVLAAIHREANRILKPDGVLVHRFNPQDHFSTVDARITSGNFLRYSSREWHWWGGSGLAYHNRLRSSDYADLFQEAGFVPIVCRERVDPRTLAAITNGELPVHDEFARHSPQELSVDYVWFAGRKRASHPPQVHSQTGGRSGDCPSEGTATSVLRSGSQNTHCDPVAESWKG